MLGDFAAVEPTVKSQVLLTLANTYVTAPATNLVLQGKVTKVVLPNFMIQSVIMDNSSITTSIDQTLTKLVTTKNPTAASVAANAGSYLNDFYDDEGWWSLAWIQAYDVSNDPDYLNTAMDIFADMSLAATTPCGGGIWWDRANTYVNAIANELYLSVASHLANRAPNATAQAKYLKIAQTQLAWFTDSGMINSKNTINDGLDSDCTNNGGTVFSYNQGVILGALAELQLALPSNTSFQGIATTISNAAIKALSVNGTLTESCEPNCGADGSQFKGVLMRNLAKMQSVWPSDKIQTYIQNNADSVWTEARNASGVLGLQWAGPAGKTGDASTHSSAMDALVGAVGVGVVAN